MSGTAQQINRDSPLVISKALVRDGAPSRGKGLSLFICGEVSA